MFRFKQFSIRQERSPMKVGTDGVLLGAWVGVRPDDRRVLDIGTGTGLIALMLAQRMPAARITGIDVEDVSEARENALASPWAARLDFVQGPVQEFAPTERYNLIVSNPPFFVDSLTCPDRGRTAARHAVLLPFEALRDAVLRLLAPEGRFALILPTAEARRFKELCRGSLVPARCTLVRTTSSRPVRRVLLEFVRDEDGAIQGGGGSTAHDEGRSTARGDAEFISCDQRKSAACCDSGSTAFSGPEPAVCESKWSVRDRGESITSNEKKSTARGDAESVSCDQRKSAACCGSGSTARGGIEPTVCDERKRDILNEGGAAARDTNESFVREAKAESAAGGGPAPAAAAGEVPSKNATADGIVASCPCTELVIGTGAHETYTDEYRALTRDFYLKF